MGVDPPFLYDRPSRSSFAGPDERGFNPKAVSHSCWAPKLPPPKIEGPLINAKEINRHPDSYYAPPYGNLNWKPLSPHTKTKVKWTRFLQLFLRTCALIGAAGLLVCVISLTGLDRTLGWIVRITPGIAILHTIYGIYHLARSHNERPPLSTASYMIFASIFDATLIPFYVFTAMMAHPQYLMNSGSSGAWDSLFHTDFDKRRVILSTYLVSIVNGGIHLVSLGISIYLAIQYRKISKLPPDMNPLEDNLTSRHKRNKSSLSMAASEVVNRSELHLSAPLMDPPRQMPFLHTRTGSSTTLSSFRGTSDQSNRASYSELPSQSYRLASSPNALRSDLRRTVHSPKRSSLYSESRPTSTRPTSSQLSMIRPQSMQPKQSTSEDNWITYPSPSTSPLQPVSIHPPELQYLRDNQENNSLPKPNKYDFVNRSPRPLEMNPPTPPIASQRHRTVLTPAAGNSSSPATQEELAFRRNEGGQLLKDSFAENGKTRFYGNLYGRGKRVISSGLDPLKVSGMRTREVSGKGMEEGRGQGIRF